MEYLPKEITGMIPEVGIIPSIIQQGRSFANRKKSCEPPPPKRWGLLRNTEAFPFKKFDI
jgi:hypothetical protein